LRRLCFKPVLGFMILYMGCFCFFEIGKDFIQYKQSTTIG
jgi:hypothetical protein